jgi:hypothetical protein
MLLLRPLKVFSIMSPHRLAAKLLTRSPALGLDGRNVSRDNFPLPRLKFKLHSLAVKIHSGIGFFVLSGLPETKYSPGDSLVIYLGIAAYIGHRRGRQDSHGNVLSRNHIPMQY